MVPDPVAPELHSSCPRVYAALLILILIQYYLRKLHVISNIHYAIIVDVTSTDLRGIIFFCSYSI